MGLDEFGLPRRDTLPAFPSREFVANASVVGELASIMDASVKDGLCLISAKNTQATIPLCRSLINQPNMAIIPSLLDARCVYIWEASSLVRSG